jgi:hypothetical protein
MSLCSSTLSSKVALTLFTMWTCLKNTSSNTRGSLIRLIPFDGPLSVGFRSASTHGYAKAAFQAVISSAGVWGASSVDI